MKYLYGINKKGKVAELAKIYESHEHTVQSGFLDKYYRFVFSRLHHSGHKVYIVGGAVRDMLLGQVPKDIDFITSASLTQTRRLFRSARIIGKRFPIVLIKTLDHQVEISSFIQDIPDTSFSKTTRSLPQNQDAVFLADVLRRDFTCNALYYNIITNQITDFQGGVEHIQKKVLIALNDDYVEDPVRILRAYKYATCFQFQIPRKTKRALLKHAPLLQQISPSRITEELSKLICGRHTAIVLQEYYKQKLLLHILPVFFEYLQNLAQTQRTEYFAAIAEYDTTTLKKDVTLIKLIGPYITSLRKMKGRMNRAELFSLVKKLLYPASFPNLWIQRSIAHCLIQTGNAKETQKHAQKHTHKKTSAGGGVPAAPAHKNISRPNKTRSKKRPQNPEQSKKSNSSS